MGIGSLGVVLGCGILVSVVGLGWGCGGGGEPRLIEARTVIALQTKRMRNL